MVRLQNFTLNLDGEIIVIGNITEYIKVIIDTGSKNSYQNYYISPQKAKLLEQNPPFYLLNYPLISIIKMAINRFHINFCKFVMIFIFWQYSTWMMALYP